MTLLLSLLGGIGCYLAMFAALWLNIALAKKFAEFLME